MTRDEFQAVPAALLDGAWAGEFTETDETAYFVMLEEFDVEAIVRALKALRGAKFRPTPGEIVEAMTGEQAARPTFDEMMALLFYGKRSLLYGVRGVDPWPAIGEAHPLIGQFIRRMGLERLRDMPVLDEDEGKWRIKELREAWSAHVEAFDGREVATLAGYSGGESLHRFDPLAALDAARPELPSGPA